MKDTSWPGEWTRATLAQSALAIVASSRTTYGYEILQRLQEAGFGKIKGGTLYPILARLEAEGWISSSWGEGSGGPGRKLVSITEEGRKEVARRRAEWRDFSMMINHLWDESENTDDEPARTETGHS